MTDFERHMIPLDVANEVLAAFGIGEDNRAYQRWMREDGFRQVDFEGVLGNSDRYIAIDWRNDLAAATDEVLGALASLSVCAEVDIDDDDISGTVAVGDAHVTVHFGGDEARDFDEVIRAVNGVLGDVAEFRKLRSCEGTDGWAYALLRKEEWQSLERHASDVIGRLFSNLCLRQ